MTTVNKLSKSDQARINGAKSKGPTSIEGKARSSQNAIKHGFAAVINVVLRIEDKPAFDLHVDGFRASFKPVDYFEQTLVEQLAAINWRQSRLTALETALIDAQVDLQFDNVQKIHPESGDDPYFHLLLAWQALARQPKKPEEEELKDSSLPPDGYNISSLELVRRYQTSLDRQFRNTLLNLRQYRKDFAPPSSSAATTTTSDRSSNGEEPKEPTETDPPTAQQTENRPGTVTLRPVSIIKTPPSSSDEPSPLPEK